MGVAGLACVILWLAVAEICDWLAPAIELEGNADGPTPPAMLGWLPMLGNPPVLVELGGPNPDWLFG